MFQLTVEGLKQLQSAGLKYEQIIPAVMRVVLDEAGQDTVDTMKGFAPHVTGSLVDSIKSVPENINEAEGFAVKVGPIDLEFGGPGAGRAIEKGRPRGVSPPPMYPLMYRYGFTPGVAYRVARSIGREGVRGQMFVWKTYKAMRQRMVDTYGIRMLRNIVHGAL